MFYSANALLYNYNYKVGDKIAHKVTYDEIKISKSKTSLERAKEFLYEVEQILND